MIEWLPTSEDQLRDALDQEILTERHTLEFKREPPSGKGDKKELARAELTAHLQVGAAELQRLLDLLAQRKELAHRKEREAPRG